MKINSALFLFIIICCGCRQQSADVPVRPLPIYHYDDNIQPRWSSQENLNGIKGSGGTANNGAKGYPYDSIKAGESKTLLHVTETGIINRIWITIDDRSPEMLRSLRIDMYWDNDSVPAVSVPFGDFFGIGLGKTTAFENTFFANPEGRSFNCFIPMPFRKAARIVVTNESKKQLRKFFFDVDFQVMKQWNDSFMYFHSYWHRDTATALGHDFELLPLVKGKGRYLGVNIGINAHARYEKTWWGEGEVKMFLDGDKDLATLVGTGTEDYIGTGWGQGKFIQTYSGCPVADEDNRQWCYYRYHVVDPVFFQHDFRITLQQMGGGMKADVAKLQREKVPLIPVSIDGTYFKLLYEKKEITPLDDPSLPDGWTNFYRSDDVSATTYFYLDKTSSGLPALQPVAWRTH
ncbi:MAG: DUF2961 domain-containing protein [Azospira oryzae]|nr:hypothetical protein [Cytophaga sp.]PZR39418.1 MAG: DUF2961 domain-containing protein [Azospira oryzae]